MYNCALYSQSRIKKDAPMLTLPVHWVTVLKLIPFFYLRLSLSTTWRNMRRLILLSFFLFFGSSSSSDYGEITNSSGCVTTDIDKGRVFKVGSQIFNIYITSFSQVGPVFFPSPRRVGLCTTPARQLMIIMERSGAPPRPGMWGYWEGRSDKYWQF